MVKVLVVGTGGALAGSGITTVADQMTRVLADMGHASDRMVLGARRRQSPNRLNLENLGTAVLDSVALWRHVRRHLPDLVWIHAFGVPSLPALRTLAQVLAAAGRQRPVVVQFHAFGFEEQLARGGVVLRALMRLLARAATTLVVVHDRAAEALGRSITAGAVRVLPNWVDVKPTPMPLPLGPPWRLIFVGSLTRRKGLPAIIEALRRLSDLQVVLKVVGGTGDEGKGVAEAIRSDASDLVEEGRLEFVGEVDALDVRRCLAQSHLFVLPSAAEGMPMALLEAMAEGRPVVVSAVGNMGNVVARAACGVVLHGTDPEEIAVGIRAALRSGDQLARWGVQAHAYMSTHCSPEAAGERLAEILALAMGAEPQTRSFRVRRRRHLSDDPVRQD